MLHTAENVENLATAIVNDWDLDTLIDYAVTQLTNHYMEDEESFIEDWNERNSED